MKDKFAVLGVALLVVILLTISVSIMLSCCFTWEGALSDLGDPLVSNVHILFNSGLTLAGIMLAVFSIKALASCARRTSWICSVSGVMLSLVGVVNLSFGFAHTAVAYAFFASMWLASLAFAFETKSRLAWIGVGSAIPLIMMNLGFVNASIAVQEIAFFAMASPWIVWTSMIMLRK
jgi:hypothetical protein